MRTQPKIVEIYFEEEKFNARLNCTVPGAWVAEFDTGTVVAICRDYEANNASEAKRKYLSQNA